MRFFCAFALLFAGCDLEGALPATFELTASRFDPATCIDEDVQLVLATEYWEEWMDYSSCRESNLYFVGTDGRCYTLFGLCQDEPPLRTDDPAFQPTDEQEALCDLYWTGGREGYATLCGS